jgi:hypothetical protein
VTCKGPREQARGARGTSPEVLKKVRSLHPKVLVGLGYGLKGVSPIVLMPSPVKLSKGSQEGWANPSVNGTLPQAVHIQGKYAVHVLDQALRHKRSFSPKIRGFHSLINI